jgi:hypothetical protein
MNLRGLAELPVVDDINTVPVYSANPTAGLLCLTQWRAPKTNWSQTREGPAPSVRFWRTSQLLDQRLSATTSALGLPPFSLM